MVRSLARGRPPASRVGYREPARLGRQSGETIIRGLNYLRRQAKRFGPAAWVRVARERTSPFWCPACEARVDLFEPLYENLKSFQETGFDYTRRGFQTLHW